MGLFVGEGDGSAVNSEVGTGEGARDGAVVGIGDGATVNNVTLPPVTVTEPEQDSVL